MRLRHLAWLMLLCSTLSAYAFAADAKHFDSDGVNIRYFSSGQGEALVLIHGFSGSADTAWIKPGIFDGQTSRFRLQPPHCLVGVTARKKAETDDRKLILERLCHHSPPSPWVQN